MAPSTIATRGLMNPDGVAPPLGMYSHIGFARKSTVLFLAGQLANDADGHLVGLNDFPRQVEQSFSNVASLLRAMGASFDDVINFNTYLARPEDVPTFFELRRKLFPKLFSSAKYPPNNLFIVAQLFHPDYLFEVVATAAIDDVSDHRKGSH